MADTAEEQYPQSAAWGERAPLSDPYFDKGQYLMAIRRVGQTKNGDPNVTLQVTQSHDGRRVNMYATMNFNMSAGTADSMAYNRRKFTEFRQAMDAMDGIDPTALIDQELTLNVRERGYWGRCPISFREADNYRGSNFTDPANRPIDERNPPINSEPEPDFTDNNIPF